MTQRDNLANRSPYIAPKLTEFEQTTGENAAEQSFCSPVDAYIPQPNNCAFCPSRHVKRADNQGDAKPLTPCERAARAWAELVGE